MNDIQVTGAPDKPLHQQAQERIDDIYNTLINRKKTIEHEMSILTAEHEAVDRALVRIAPPQPSPIGVSGSSGAVYGTLSAPRNIPLNRW